MVCYGIFWSGQYAELLQNIYFRGHRDLVLKGESWLEQYSFGRISRTRLATTPF